MIQARDPSAKNIVLGASHLADAQLIVKQVKDTGLNAKAWAFSVGPSTPEFGKALGKDATYVLGVTPWTPAMKFEGKDIYGMPKEFSDAFKARFGYEPSYHSASAVAAFIAFPKAIEAAGSLVITNLLSIAAGWVFFKDREITGLPAHQIARMGVARTFQVVKPFKRTSVKENVAIGAMYGAGGRRCSAV